VSVFNIMDQRSSEKETVCDVVMEIDNGDWKALGLSRPEKNMTEWMGGTSIYSAIMTACGFRGKVTMYLYSPGAVEKDHNKLVAVHPGLKDTSVDGAKLRQTVYTTF